MPESGCAATAILTPRRVRGRAHLTAHWHRRPALSVLWPGAAASRRAAGAEHVVMSMPCFLATGEGRTPHCFRSRMTDSSHATSRTPSDGVRTPSDGVYPRILMEEVAPRIECTALRAREAGGAKRTHNPDGSVNGRPPAGAWSERCQAKRWLASAPGLPYAAGATGVWLLGSAPGQPAALDCEMPPPSCEIDATTSTGMMPLQRECGCARRHDAWRGSRPRWGGGRR